jgi:hypothetical protein
MAHEEHLGMLRRRRLGKGGGMACLGCGLYVVWLVWGVAGVWEAMRVTSIKCGRCGVWPVCGEAGVGCGRCGVWPLWAVIGVWCGLCGLWPVCGDVVWLGCCETDVGWQVWDVIFVDCGRVWCGLCGLWPVCIVM